MAGWSLLGGVTAFRFAAAPPIWVLADPPGGGGLDAERLEGVGTGDARRGVSQITVSNYGVDWSTGSVCSDVPASAATGFIYAHTIALAGWTLLGGVTAFRFTAAPPIGVLAEPPGGLGLNAERLKGVGTGDARRGVSQIAVSNCGVDWSTGSVCSDVPASAATGSSGSGGVIQRRTDGSEDFYRTWDEYRDGFGDLNNEFWLGNTNIHRLSRQGVFDLRIDMEDFEGNRVYAQYTNFSLASEQDYFRLRVGNYSGDAVTYKTE
ncbi:ficolin-1-A-like [Gigantopelta aegis]|uniref:ficolin-1-A-like n=1 Tax=Gigantopelta aegis TaxID=1735272 RepID=UPI001B887611|nr:ficolin-1-A-like [Gigantopelta aegis]